MKNLFLLSLIGQSGQPLNPIDLILSAGLVGKAVIALLFLASVISWTIILYKWWVLRAAVAANRRFADKVWEGGTLEAALRTSRANGNAPMSRVFQDSLMEFNTINNMPLDRAQKIDLLETNLARTLTKSASLETEGLQRYLPFLASTASTSPYVGLFGTVWGIMTSFINIGSTGASNLAVVAPGIAEALIATAMGLFAAIPAVVFYNYFLTQIKGLRTEMGHFGSDFLNTAKRSL